MSSISRLFGATLCIAILAGASVAAQADRPAGTHARSTHGAVLDHRYSHDRYYPPRGHIVRNLPPGHLISRWRGSPYYFHGGVWYRPARAGWAIVTPPVGLVVPLLPPVYTTVWVSGIPYYYANDVYYAWRPAQRGYVVVEPPRESASVDTQSAGTDFYVYPKNGQSAEQQASDRYDCHRWAVGETGFDPTMPSGGVAPEQAPDKRTAYLRAMTACLEAHYLHETLHVIGRARSRADIRRRRSCQAAIRLTRRGNAPRISLARTDSLSSGHLNGGVAARRLLVNSAVPALPLAALLSGCAPVEPLVVDEPIGPLRWRTDEYPRRTHDGRRSDSRSTRACH